MSQDTAVIPRLLNVEEVCQRLSVGRSTIYTLLGEGKITAVKVGRRTCFREDEVARFVASCPSFTGRAA